MKSTTKRLFGIVALSLSLFVFVGCTAAQPAATQAPAATAAPVATDAPTATEAPAATDAATVDASAEQKVFTVEELAKYNGKDGNAAYVAVDGKVYDLSAVPQWSNGSHAGGSLQAGADQSDAIGRSPHGKKVLENLPVVGVLQ